MKAASESLGMSPSWRAEVREPILRCCSLDMWKVFSVFAIFQRSRAAEAVRNIVGVVLKIVCSNALFSSSV